MKSKYSRTGLKLDAALYAAANQRVTQRGNKSFAEYVVDLITADLIATGGFDEVASVKRVAAQNNDLKNARKMMQEASREDAEFSIRPDLILYTPKNRKKKTG